MSIDKAITFVKKATNDKMFRKECYQRNSKIEVMKFFGFDEFEFEDAVNMQLVKCQSYEEAEVFQEIKIWFSIL